MYLLNVSGETMVINQSIIAGNQSVSLGSRTNYTRSTGHIANSDTGYKYSTFAFTFVLEWKSAVPILTEWRKHYEVEVIAGRMGLKTAVSQFLADQGMI